jgi:uncharacterized protein YqeY
MLQQKIEAAYIAAFKAKDIVQKNILSIVKSKITEWTKLNPGKELSDVDVIGIVSSEIKKCNQTVDACRGAETVSAVNALQQGLREIEILTTFLPAQLTEADIVAEIEAIKATNPARLMPAVMQHFSKNFKGQYDAKLLQSLIK